MLGFLWKLIVGSFHSHLWETKDERGLTMENGATGKRIYLRCFHCGNWKKKDLA